MSPVPLLFTTKTIVLRSILLQTSLLLLTLGGCTWGQTEWTHFEATVEEAEGLPVAKRLEVFENILQTSHNDRVRYAATKMVIEGLYQTSQYQKLQKYLRYLVAHASDPLNQLEAKQQLADNSYFHLKKYKEAIFHYSQLIGRGYRVLANRLMVVKSYFHRDDLPQALLEAEGLLKQKLDPHVRFELLLLKANIAFASESFRSSSQLFESVIEEFPELSQTNYVLLNLAMSLEEEGKVDRAIEALTALKAFYHTPSFVESKIQHLSVKLKHLPGARRSAR